MASSGRPTARILSWICNLAYLSLALRPYRRAWRQADPPNPAWNEMTWLIMIPLIALTLACAMIPLFD
jgi:hypothetical protein